MDLKKGGFRRRDIRRHIIFIENTETCLQTEQRKRRQARKHAMCRSREKLLTRDAETPSRFNVVAGEDAQ